MRLTCQDLGHAFDDHTWLFSGLTFELGPGRVTAVTGPSGSGKSTLLSILAGSLRPRSGRVAYAGIERVAWVFQNPFGVPRRSALDHVALPLLCRDRRTRGEADGLARGLLDDFGLSKVSASPFGSLSGGERQRLMLARAVAAAPDLLLVDEPTGQLDRVNAASVVQVLGALSSAGMIVAIATHDPLVASACADLINLGDVT